MMNGHGGGKPPPRIFNNMMSDTNNVVHVYQFRQVFVDDEHVGKYDGVTKTIRLREEHGGHSGRVAAFFKRRHGIHAQVVVGDEALAEVAALVEFPPEVLGLMVPQLGDRTPEVMAWAKKNFPAAEYERRYGNGVRKEEALPCAAVVNVPRVERGTEPIPMLDPEEEAEWEDEAGKLVETLPVKRR